MPPPSTPQKAPGDASKPFSFQFGSLSPGLMNGMQIPARTSSARPNLDEQKRDQARHDAIRSGPPVPVPPAPKHPLQKRDSGATDQSNAGDSLAVPKGEKDQVPPIPPSVQSQKPPAHVMPGISMQMPFNQPQVPIQFNGPNTSIQSQGMASASLQLPMPMPVLPVGNAPPSMQQQMFVAGLQPHTIQPQGIMHQGQGLSFGVAQINAQFSPQLGTLGMGVSPYSQQQGAKFGGPCKTLVKITHPETHQEVRLDKRTEGFSDGGPSSQSHPNVPPQAQHISSYPSNHPVSYYTNSYSLSPPYFPAQSSLPLPGTQITPTSQAPRFNPPINQGAQRMSLMNSQDKPAPEISRSSSNIAKGRKKRKEILRKAYAAGATLDLYMAYKGPEEKKEAVKSSRGTEIASENTHANQATAETSPNEAVVSDDVEQAKAEIDDWEDAADVSSPALEPSTSGQQGDVFVPSGENINGFVARKYSRDFLLKFAERCTNLPGNFEVTHGIAGTQITPTSQAPRFNPPVNQGAQRMTLMNSQDKPAPEISRSSSNIAKGRKKRKEILRKADAAGATLDLYMAYKGPEEKKEAVKSSRGTEIASENTHANQATAETSPNEAVVSDDVEQAKAEIDDWEDAADVSSPALEPSTSGQQVDVFVPSGENINGFVARKYSRDFLLKFAERCTNLPGNFEVTHDMAEVFNPSANVSRFVDRDSHPSPGRTVDRQSGGAPQDRRGSGLVDDDEWSKLGPFGPGRDLRLDVGLGPNLGLRPGQGGNYGVLRNPRAQTPVQYAGGILSGPMQSPGFQGGIQRNNSDADRWQRATGFQQKGLIPSPQTPLQMMHRAEKKYEVGKVADEEQAKQRQLKAILNKLTPQNFEKLFEQVKAVNIDNATTLTGLISQIFDKALMEPTFCEMYANLCCHLAQELPHFSEDDDKITFKRVLLNMCQEEFERGERQ